MDFAHTELRLALNALAAAEAGLETTDALYHLLDAGRSAEVTITAGSHTVSLPMSTAASVHLVELVLEMNDGFNDRARQLRQQITTWRAELELMDAEARPPALPQPVAKRKRRRHRKPRT